MNTDIDQRHEQNELSPCFFEAFINTLKSPHYVCYSDYPTKLFIFVNHRQAAYLELMQHFYRDIKNAVLPDVCDITCHDTCDG